MAEANEDDLFRQSSMSFGEHLEELRRRLFRASAWLFVGVIIGFCVGQQVVQAIQRPLTDALKDYVKQKSKDRLAKPTENEKSDGDSDLLNEGYVGDKVFLQPSTLFDALSQYYPDLKKPAEQVHAPGDQPSLIPLTVWRLSKDDPQTQSKSIELAEPFMTYVKAAMITGVVLASPMIFWELWQFVAAGLYPHERRYVYIFFPFSIGLFVAGVLLAFFAAFPPVLKFLLGFNEYLGIAPDPRIENWLNFVLFLPLAFGIGFQLPLVMLFVNRIGVISVQTYTKQWRIAILVIFILAVILCPSPDIYSMCLMAVPMTILYFGGILLCAYTSGRRPEGLGGE